MELVVQPPIDADYALCFKAMLVDILRKGKDFWRQSGIVVRAGSKTKKVFPHVLKVYDKNTNCRRNEKKSGKSAQVFRSKLPVQRLREEDERQERQRENHGIMMWTPSLGCNDNLQKNKKANQE